MTARVIMLQGTGSDVGKSVLTAALCRIARDHGLSVAPFKPQNMSNNAAACADGGEIGRAQALQAIAAGLDPHVDMNPVLLKPQTDRVSQVVVHGRATHAEDAASYISNRGRLLDAVMTSFKHLASRHDLIIVEGAGSPAEINLRRGDIANMGFARRAGVPVWLVGDIEKGGVIASVVGTKAVLDPEDAALIQGFLINKFRGDPSLFDSGVEAIEDRTGWPCLGVVPWINAMSALPAEDAVDLKSSGERDGGNLKIVAPMLSRMANFDDADPLRLEQGVDFHWIAPGKPLPRDADVVILFGTKSTLGDLDFLRTQGWDHDVMAHARGGGTVLGICGGYQMLGRKIIDPQGVDGRSGQAEGLGLLDVTTIMASDKKVSPVKATSAATGASIDGYEIHMGRTDGPDCVRPVAFVEGMPEGATSPSGRVSGTYLHGIFAADAFRRSWLENLGSDIDQSANYRDMVDRALDQIAEEVKASLDTEQLFKSARVPCWGD